MIKRKVLTLMLLVFAVGAWSCPDQEAVRRMSSGLVDQHEKLANSLNQTFAVEDQFVEDQLTVTTATVDDLTREIQAQYVARARAQFDAHPNIDEATKTQILMDMAVSVSRESAVNEQGKRQLQELTAKLKQKHKDIADAYAALNAAEKEMDQYIQLKKADELVFERIFDKIHINTDKLIQGQQDVSDIIKTITDLLPKKGKTP